MLHWMLFILSRFHQNLIWKQQWGNFGKRQWKLNPLNEMGACKCRLKAVQTIIIASRDHAGSGFRRSASASGQCKIVSCHQKDEPQLLKWFCGKKSLNRWIYKSSNIRRFAFLSFESLTKRKDFPWTLRASPLLHNLVGWSSLLRMCVAFIGWRPSFEGADQNLTTVCFHFRCLFVHSRFLHNDLWGSPVTKNTLLNVSSSCSLRQVNPQQVFWCF